MFDIDIQKMQEDKSENQVYVDFPEKEENTTSEKASEEAKESEEEITSISDLVFMVQYVQDYNPTTCITSELTNLHFCPDEGFESDLDNNFK